MKSPPWRDKPSRGTSTGSSQMLSDKQANILLRSNQTMTPSQRSRADEPVHIALSFKRAEKEQQLGAACAVSLVWSREVFGQCR